MTLPRVECGGKILLQSDHLVRKGSVQFPIISFTNICGLTSNLDIPQKLPIKKFLFWMVFQ